MNKIYILLLIFIFSCSSKKDILYLQNYENEELYSNKYVDYKIDIDDILKIDIYSDSPEMAAVVDPSSITNRMASTRESWLFNGYQVNSLGEINIPSIGSIKVKELTVNQVKELIFENLIEMEILNKPTIDVKVINMHFTVLGEVNSPGRYEFLKNNLNILEALGIAGDLTINGKRNDIKLIRNINGKNKIFKLDLTKTDFIEGDGFQVFSRDIILVNPNSTRIKNAGIIGNSGTLISLLSFILSSIIVINSN